MLRLVKNDDFLICQINPNNVYEITQHGIIIKLCESLVVRNATKQNNGHV